MKVKKSTLRLPLTAQSHIILYLIPINQRAANVWQSERKKIKSDVISQQSLSACVYGVIHSPILSTMCNVEAVSSVAHDHTSVCSSEPYFVPFLIGYFEFY